MNSSVGESTQLQTKRDAAQYLQIGARTLDYWMKNGTIPFFKIGKLVRFRQTDLDQALEKYRHHITQK